MLSEAEIRAVFDAAPDGFLIVGSDGLIRSANPKTVDLFGWSQEELHGQPVDMLLPESVRRHHVDHRQRFSRNPHDRPMGVGLDLRGQRRDGSTFPVEVSLSPWTQEGGDVQVICSVRDVSAYRRLRNFSAGALRASEDERKRIARELHDDTAQRLATLILRVRMLAAESDDARRAELFEKVREEIVEAAEGVKQISRGLRPPEIEELGLELAVQAHARTLREGGVFDATVVGGGVDPHLDATAKLALYRIIQEGLSNARRHSGSGQATVRLAVEDSAVVVEVSDHGTGFALAGRGDGQRGLGLIGMQERATMIGGRIVLDSTPGEGTTVRVVVPIESEIDDG